MIATQLLLLHQDMGTAYDLLTLMQQQLYMYPAPIPASASTSAAAPAAAAAEAHDSLDTRVIRALLGHLGCGVRCVFQRQANTVGSSNSSAILPGQQQQDEDMQEGKVLWNTAACAGAVWEASDTNYVIR